MTATKQQGRDVTVAATAKEGPLPSVALAKEGVLHSRTGDGGASNLVKEPRITRMTRINTRGKIRVIRVIRGKKSLLEGRGCPSSPFTLINAI